MSSILISAGTTGVSAGANTNTNLTVQNVSNDCRVSAVSTGTAANGSIPQYVATNASFVGVTNSTVETSLIASGSGSLTLLAPVTGSGFRFMMAGTISDNSTNVTYTYKVKRGATALTTSTLSTATQGNSGLFWVDVCVVNYSTTTCKIAGMMNYGPSVASNFGFGSSANVTISNASAALDVTWKWTAASTNTAVTATNFLLWTF